MRARRTSARAGIAAACLRTVVVLSVAAAAGASATAGAKPPNADGSLPPGQAKKIAGDSPLHQTGQGAIQGVGAPAQAPASAAPPAVERPGRAGSARPPHAGGPKRSRQTSAATPSQATPGLPAAASPAPAASTSPPSAPVAEQPATGDRSPRSVAPRNRRGSRARRQAARTTGAPRRLTGGSSRDAGGARGGAHPASSSGAAAGPKTSATRRARPAPVPAAEPSPVVRTVRDIVETVPGWMKVAIATLGALSLLLAAGYAFTALRARSLARQRGELLGEIGLLQRALLPDIPKDLGALRASVAYRPADGPGAGGDFYDALPLPGDRVGFVLGDVSGHGRDALERTAFMRYTLRAYLEAGLEPRAALQVAERAIGDGLGGDFATVLLAVHDAGDGSLTYACAGHPAPVVVHGAPFQPVIAGSSPPIGIGERTGLRQTTVPLPPGTLACLYTDGLIEARTADGLLGRERLERLVAALGDGATATDLLERISDEALAVPDDMAACLLTPSASVTSGGFRSEQLELSEDELAGPLPGRFLDECGVPAEARADALADVAAAARRSGGAVIAVVLGGRRTVEVLPRNVESIEAASLSTAAGASQRLRAAAL